MSNQPTVVIQQAPGASGLSIAGLIFSILGWFTCGLLCIPGAFLSLLGLFSKGPKGMAIAGLIIGFPGTMFFAFVGLGMIMGFLGLGAVATATTAAGTGAAVGAVISDAEPDQESLATVSDLIEIDDSTGEEISIDTDVVETLEPLDENPVVVSPVVSDPPPLTDKTPESDPEPAPVPSAEPKHQSRLWQDSTGNFKVQAVFKSYSNGEITIKRDDDGREIKIPVDKLSEADQQYVDELIK